MLLEDVDDLHEMETSHMESLRRNLLQTRLKHPIEDHNGTEDPEGLCSERDRKRSRVQYAAHTQ